MADEVSLTKALSIAAEIVAAGQKSGLLVGTKPKAGITPVEIAGGAVMVFDILIKNGVTSIETLKSLTMQIQPILGMFK